MSTKPVRKRPLSPHLTIYKPQISSVLSIMHRITGVCLFIGLIVLAWLIIAILLQSLGMGFIEVDFNIILNSIVFKVMLIGLVFCLNYHFLNGVRHLYWDMGLGLTNKSVIISGVVVIILTGILTMLTCIVTMYKTI